MSSHYRKANSSEWKRLVKRVVMEEDGICHLCGKDGATSADHLIPVKFRPDLELDRDNLHAVHKLCNEKRGAKPLKQKISVINSREW